VRTMFEDQPVPRCSRGGGGKWVSEGGEEMESRTGTLAVGMVQGSVLRTGWEVRMPTAKKKIGGKTRW